MQLRTQYTDEIERQTKVGCTACKKNAIKSKFMNKVWELHMLATLKKK